MTTGSRVICLACLASLCLPTPSTIGADFEPEYESAELHGPGGTRYARVGIDRKPQRIREAGRKRFVIDGSVVEVLTDKEGEQPRRIESADGRKLQLEGGTGEVLAATSLPRMVDGRPLKIIPGALIWSCERGCLVRLHHSEYDFSSGFFGPGAGAANDALCRVAWYREYVMRLPACWFSADPPRGVAAFGRNHLYRPAAAYVEKKDKPVYHFVINVVDLETGVDHDLTLAIPYHGDFPMPEQDYSAMPGYTHATQPHLLGIGGLSIEGDVLRVVMNRPGTIADDTALSFDLSGK